MELFQTLRAALPTINLSRNASVNWILEHSETSER